MKCVVCQDPLDLDVAVIGHQYPSAIYLEDMSEKEFGLSKSSLNLSRCSNQRCNLVQLTEPINLDLVYQHYPYQSGTTATMRSILLDVAKEALSFQPLQPGSVVLDIGGNDGTLLSQIECPESILVNIDAASNINQNYQIPNYTYVNAKFNEATYMALEIPSPTLIFSIAVFYQLNNPLQFLQDVQSIMDDNSLFVLQMTYLDSMYSNNIFDNVVHEHVTYFSLRSLMFIAELAGLKVVGAKVVNSYGGSLRTYLVRSSSERTIDSLKDFTSHLLAAEDLNKTDSMEALANFGSEFNSWQLAAREMLDSQYDKYGPIIGMGASTKGNMILQALNVDSRMMPYILDNNSKKIGSRTTGSFIPIVSEGNLEDLETNVLILPYYYKDFFLKIIKSRINPNRFIEFITPLPRPKVIRVFGE
jgi:NDP-4-keto-2,6-dideoxyhexose 3-C-methyltransferase